MYADSLQESFRDYDRFDVSFFDGESGSIVILLATHLFQLASRRAVSVVQDMPVDFSKLDIFLFFIVELVSDLSYCLHGAVCRFLNFTDYLLHCVLPSALQANLF